MEVLKDLVSLISTQKIRQIKLITEDPDISSKIKQLYEGVNSNKFNSDEEAIQALYPDNNSSKSYSILKNRLKERLINTLFFIDIHHYSKTPYQVAIHRIKKSTAAINILFERNKRNAAIDLSEKIVKLAIKYDEIETVMLLSKNLRRHYTVFAYNKKKKKYYSDLMNTYHNYFQQEIQAEELYIDLAYAVLHNKDINEYKFGQKGTLKEIIRNQKTNKNYYFNFYTYNSLYLLSLSERDFQRLVDLTDDAIKFFRSKEGFSPIAVFDMTFKKGYALLNLGEIEEALKTFELCKEMGPTRGGISWFNIHAYICMTAIILKRYHYAIEILNTVLKEKNFEKLHETFKEPWLIKEAYLNFLIKMDKIEDSKVTESMRSFKMGRFLNEVPLYSKDKRGYNIAILIIQMLFFLLDRKYSKFIDRMDALNQYSYRYLRNDDTLRSNCFVKMILKIPDANYHPLRLQRHTKKLYKTLVSTPPDIKEQSSNIEIIPYESLWELVLELLEKNK